MKKFVSYKSICIDIDDNTNQVRSIGEKNKIKNNDLYLGCWLEAPQVQMKI